MSVEKTMPHNIIVDERKKINVSGVCEVVNFDENIITVDTVMGELTIKGDDLRIEGFNVETGDLSACGRVVAFAYTGDNQKGNSFLGRIFR